MTRYEPIPRYGVLTQSTADDQLAQAVESLRVTGFAVLDAGYKPAEIQELQNRFDRMRTRYLAEHGAEALREIDDHNTIRCPLNQDAAFLDLATNARVLELCG